MVSRAAPLIALILLALILNLSIYLRHRDDSARRCASWDMALVATHAGYRCRTARGDLFLVPLTEIPR